MEDAKEFYDKDKQSQKLRIYAEEKLYETVNRIYFESILDVGCGDGHFLKRFPNKKTLGLDKNPGMIELAKENGIETVLSDITKNQDFMLKNKNSFDVVTANYVFTELKIKELESAFKNIKMLLNQNGSFCFTITNPKERHRIVFPGYKLVFDEEYQYEKTDLPFTVLVEDLEGNYVDVGIRDYHQPLEIYDSILEKNFSNIKRSNIKEEMSYAYAILYKVK
jgi:SAM-dependent methyltransferase